MTVPAARPRPRRAPGQLALAGVGLAGLAGLLLYLVPLRGVRLAAMNGLGLVSALPLASLAGLALLVLAFAALLARRRPATLALAALLAAIVFCLDGVTALVEPLPRFPTAYQIYGFAGHIAQTGHAAPDLTAYFSWPGFLALVAFAEKAAGVHSLLPVLKWWPTVAGLAALPPFLLLLGALRISWQARWLAALLLVAGNWVGQDYFSPQSFNFLLYLTFMAIVLTWFGSRPGTGGTPSRRLPGEMPARPAGAGLRALLLLLLTGIFVTSVISHQLTPFVMLATCAGLVLAGRCTPKGLPVLLAVILMAWVSYATVAYWSGHMSAVFGGFGRLASTYTSSVTSRITGTAVHRHVDQARTAVSAAMVVLAGLGWLRRWRRGIFDRAALVLAVAPVTLAVLQSYGGEIALRIYLFALPGLAALAAALFFPAVPARSGQPDAADVPDGQGPGPVASARAVWPAVLAGAVAMLLAWSFLLVRYGNEGFEQTPPGEFRAMNYIYDHDHGGVSVLWLSRPYGAAATPELPWQFRDLAEVRFVSGKAPYSPADTAGVAGELRRLGRGSYLIVANTEATYLRQEDGFPANWEPRFRRAMDGVSGITLVMSDPAAAVYQAGRPASAPRHRSARVGGQTAGASTIWSPIGLVAFALAVALLGTREIIGECVPGRRRLTASLAFAAGPAVVVLVIAVIERFRVLSLPSTPAAPGLRPGRVGAADGAPGACRAILVGCGRGSCTSRVRWPAGRCGWSTGRFPSPAPVSC